MEDIGEVSDMAEDKSILYPRYGIGWDEDELILAYYYYCILPFGKASSKSKENPRTFSGVSVTQTRELRGS